MNPRDEAPRGNPPCDDLVAGPLGNARQSLRDLLTAEAETLVTILGWVEVAMECSLEPDQRKNVRRHCQQALKLIAAIEQRNPGGQLPEPVAQCVRHVRDEVTRAMTQLDAA